MQFSSSAAMQSMRRLKSWIEIRSNQGGSHGTSGNLAVKEIHVLRALREQSKGRLGGARPKSGDGSQGKHAKSVGRYSGGEMAAHGQGMMQWKTRDASAGNHCLHAPFRWWSRAERLKEICIAVSLDCAGSINTVRQVGGKCGTGHPRHSEYIYIDVFEVTPWNLLLDAL